MHSISDTSKLQLDESDLAVVIIDALVYWTQGWVSEERFAQKLQLSVKQVHKTLRALQKAGFVALEERREKINRGKVESVADYEEVATKARTATYVSIDYPLMFDMLRLRVYLVRKQAADQIDDGQVSPDQQHRSDNVPTTLDLRHFPFRELLSVQIIAKKYNKRVHNITGHYYAALGRLVLSEPPQ
jgi:hypothetical protein